VTGEAYEEWLYKKDVTNLYSLPTNKNFWFFKNFMI
jgi:hypothetical protein